MGMGIKSKALKLKFRISHACRSLLARIGPMMMHPGSRVMSIYHSPSDMCESDRVFLYAFVRGTRPARCIEIGSRWGGSARIICAALEDNRHGRLVGLDPAPQAFIAPARALHNRFRLHKGYSPQDVPAACSLHDGPIDFAFIDAMHTHDSVEADLKGAYPFLADGAHIIMHDAFHVGIDAACNEFLAAHPDVTDLGILTRNPSKADPLCYQGFRVLRVRENRDSVLRDAYQRNDVAFPEKPSYFHNYDPFAIRVGLVELGDDGYRWVTPPGHE